jgi:hypothetical protein
MDNEDTACVMMKEFIEIIAELDSKEDYKTCFNNDEIRKWWLL